MAEIKPEDIRPAVGVNYIAPHLIKVPTGSTYVKFNWGRPVILVSLTPATAGTVYIYPGSTPTDTTALPCPAGVTFLDASGDWYIRTTSSGDETFRVIDGGGAGNAMAAAALAGLAVTVVTNNRSSFGTNQKTVTTHGTGVQLPSQVVAPGYKVSIAPLPTNTGNIYLSDTKAHAEAHTGAWILAPGAPPVNLGVTNWSAAWIDSDVDLEGVMIISEV